MAKSKKYISSKVKRKFAVGGPYNNVETQLYNPNADRTIYQAADQPSTILQQQQEAMLQQQAAANKSMYQNQLNAELARNQTQQQQTANLIEEEKAARKAEEQKQKQALATQATKGATKLGKQVAKDFAISDYGMLGNSSNLFSSANITAGAPLSPSAGVTASQMTFSNPAITSSAPLTMANYAPSTPSAVNAVMPQGLNQGVTMTSTGADAAASSASLGTAAAGIGLGLAGEGIGMYATYKQRKEDDAAKRSQYYRDADYTRREALGQIGKSTLKGAGIGTGIGGAIGGIGAPVGAALGAQAGLMYGVGKALHEERLTKPEEERGIKIGNKRFGKKLLFGDENVYSAAKDPYEIAKAQYEDSLERQAQLASAMDTAALASRTTEANTGFNIKGGNMAKYGGSIEYLKGGIAKPLPRGAKEYVGKKHEQGGIDLPGNIEVEGGETEQDNYIFSATLKLPTGLTYAQAHKNLLASGASSEEIKQLALSQEAAAGRNPNEIKTMKFAKYGGPLMYKKGGPKEGSPEFFKEKNFMLHDDGEYSLIDDTGNMVVYNPESKEYRYVRIGDREDASDYANVHFSNYNDINKIKRKTNRLFSKKNLSTDEQQTKIKKLEKRFLDTSNSEKVETKVETKAEEIPKENKMKNIKKDETTQTNISDPYKTLAYATQFAQPAYALLNPYKTKYSEPGTSISAPMTGVIPTVGTNINYGRVSAAAPIASLQAGTNAIIANAGNIAGPGGIAMQLAALEKLKSGSVAAQSAADTANMQLTAQEANAKLAASKSNQAATMQGIQLNTQVAAQNAQLQAARNAREAAAKEQARQEAYINTAGALGATGVGIGTMYKDQNQLDTQYKIALATDPTGSAARWLKENDPAAYNRYVQEGTIKKFGGPRNNYVSRLGELSKRSLKVKI